MSTSAAVSATGSAARSRAGAVGTAGTERTLPPRRTPAPPPPARPHRRRAAGTFARLPRPGTARSPRHLERRAGCTSRVVHIVLRLIHRRTDDRPVGRRARHAADVTLDLPGPALRPRSARRRIHRRGAAPRPPQRRGRRRSGAAPTCRPRDDRLDRPRSAARAGRAAPPSRSFLRGAVVSHISAAVLLGLRVWGVPAHPGARHARPGLRRTARAAPAPAHDSPGPGRGRRDRRHTGDPHPARTVVDMARAVPVARRRRRRGRSARGRARSGAAARGRGASAAAARQRPCAPVAAFADVAAERRRVAEQDPAAPARRCRRRFCNGPSTIRRDATSARPTSRWPELRTVGEFDGLGQVRPAAASGPEPRRAVVAEKRREDRLRDEGLQVARWTWDELDDPDVVVNRLLRAFARADAATARAIPGGARAGTGASPRTPRGVARGVAGYRGRP